MTLWTDLFHNRHLISRKIYQGVGSQTVTAPANAAFLVVSLGGAGSWKSGNWGHGAAFARSKITVAAGDQFVVQVGDVQHTLDADNALGDSILTKVSDSSVVCKAQAGQQAGPGLAAGCVGNDVTRSGTAWAGGLQGGASAGDDADFFPLGFGGRGATAQVAAYQGGGGGKNVYVFPGYSVTWTCVPGNGRAVLEWYDQDPGALH